MPRPLQLLVSTWHGYHTGSVDPSLRASEVGVSMGSKEICLRGDFWGFYMFLEKGLGRVSDPHKLRWL